MTPLASKVANYVHGLMLSDISRDAIEETKLHALDTIGVALAGTRTKWWSLVASFAKSQANSTGCSTVWGTWLKTGPQNAALVNGTAAHSLDYDDDPGICHIGAVIVPASLSAAEHLGVSGAELLAAMTAGYDVVTRLEEALDGERMFARGYHPTAICGTIGAAASAGKIIGLTEDQLANAFGIAGSFASGLMEFLSDGSMTKRIQPGWASQAGINAAFLAKEGFTGPHSIFEGRYGLRAFSGCFDGDKLLAGLGKRFDVLNSSLKKYPCCLYNASAVDAILDLRSAGKVHAQEIAGIKARVRQVAVDLVGNPIELKQNPRTVLDAQMSLPYSVAVALIDGRASLDQFTEDRIQDGEVLRLAKKIEVSQDPEIDALPPGDLSTILDIDLVGGRRMSVRVDYYRGHPCNRLTRDEVIEKFEHCSAKVLSPDQAAALRQSILSLEMMDNSRAFFSSIEA